MLYVLVEQFKRWLQPGPSRSRKKLRKNRKLGFELEEERGLLDDEDAMDNIAYIDDDEEWQNGKKFTSRIAKRIENNS